ncbi:MAG TPA: ATP-binding cassette domain-containing protein [Chitinophagaceae bacterium]|nr:ATP-binding cassette domain-containing protein [Chitinophagaceae bacterium]
MNIELSKAGKRFNREWIFRKADFVFKTANSYAITGPNGSGKSTLLQCIGGMLQLSEGKIEYTNGNGQLAMEKAYRHISFCAPYIEVIEEMTLLEFLNFHIQFKPFFADITIYQIIEMIDLQKAIDKQIRNFSSGMKQRLRLAQAVFSDTPILLLDEPCTNLDETGIQLYNSLITNYCQNRLVIVSSNDEVEYRFCKEKIDIQNYK